MILNLIFIVVLIIWGIPAFYMLILALAAFLRKEQDFCLETEESTSLDFLIIIPAYKEDEVVCETAQTALEQNYPSSNYEVMVLADQLKPETIDTLHDLGVQVLEVSFDVSSKTKALQASLDHIKSKFDVVLMLDADNLLEFNALQKYSTLFQEGHHVIQAERRAKNTDHPIAFFDALSEAINNRLFNQGMQALGGTGRLMGSGIAMSRAIFIDLVQELNAVGGIDKEMEVLLLQQGYSIYYAKDLWVMDEKVAQKDSFVNQRRRWVAAQWYYAWTYGFLALQTLWKGRNIDLIFKIYQMFLPARLLQPIVLALSASLALYLNSPFTLVFMIAAFVNILAIIIAIPKRFWQKDLLKMIVRIPFMVYLRVVVSLKLKGANRTFIHTPHHR